MSTPSHFHQAANDALVQLSSHLWPGAKLALVIYTPSEPEKDIVLRDNSLSDDEVLSTLRRRGLSIDGDNAYKRDLMDTITGAMAFGFQGVNPPPEGHWGKRFWDIGRAEGEERERLTNQRDAILLQTRVWAGEAKTQQSITREVGEILGGIPSWGPIAAGVEALRQQLGEASSQLERHVPLYEAINRAAGELPDGWSICLNVERYGAAVELFDQNGNEVDDFSTNNERLDYTVNDAVDAALDAQRAQQEQHPDHSVAANKMVGQCQP